jgi:hypothetical protein
MRWLLAILTFIAVLIPLTAFCTWGWATFVNGTVYACTDSVPFDFLLPGDWVHGAITVERVVPPRTMSEPDVIKSGWNSTGLWSLWVVLAGGSLFASLFLARLQMEREPEE